MKTVIRIKTQQCCILNNPLQREIAQIPGVFGVNADMFAGIISVDHTNETDLEQLYKSVTNSGYELIEDEFKNRANQWDSPEKVMYAKEFVTEIKKYITFSEEDKIMDFGCGTGLVGLEILPEVNFAVMADTSPSMIEVLESKLDYAQLEKIEIINGPLSLYKNKDIDKLLALMALHHIDKLDETIDLMSKTIINEGMLIIGDMLTEDGSFHAPALVPHNGFDLDELSGKIEKHGFEVLIKHPYSIQSKRDIQYHRFILIAKNK